MATFDSILKLSIGGSAFQLASYSVKREPQRKDGILTHYATVLSGEGYIEAENASDLAAKILETNGAPGVVGQDLIVTANGVLEYQLLAARCQQGGPDVSIEMLPDEGDALLKRFSFEAKGSLYVQADGTWDEEKQKQDAIDSRTLKETTKPGELRHVVISGVMNGPNLTAIWAWVVAQAKEEFPWPLWVLQRDMEVGSSADRLNYTLTADEMAMPLPGNVAAAAVDGEATVSRERGEGFRMIETWDFDFLVTGDPQQLINLIRPDLLPFRESTRISFHKEVRLQASFVVISSANADGILEWQSTVEMDQEDVVSKAEVYDGVGVRQVLDFAVYELVCSGRAVGLMEFPAAPHSPSADLVELGFAPSKPPRVTTTRMNEFEWETSWHYAFAGPKSAGSVIGSIRQAMGRPQRQA